MKYSFLKLLAVVSLFIVGCSSEAQAPESLEEKQKLIASYKEEMATLKEKIKALELEINESGDNKARDLRLVEWEKLSKATFKHFIEVPGDVKSDKNVLVNPKVSGVIIKRNFEEGAYIQKGQVIAVIDAELLKINIEEMETRLSLAKTIFERQENLWNQNIGSEVQYLQAKNEKDALEKNLEALNEQLENAYVKAPISGTLDEYFMNTGEMSSPQSPIARIVNLSSIEISADVSETYVKNVKKGDKVEVSFTAVGENMELPVAAVGQFINPQNRTFKITMNARNKDGYLKPNTLAMVKINDYTKEGAVTVPANLIQKSTSGDSFLYIMEKRDGKSLVKKIVVKTGRTFNGRTVIEEGLKEGDMVITTGYSEVIDGEEVKDVTNA
ncbi:MAG: efflux RND transporter periplasmic adaptor subunit [Bacteroidota bacterium]